MTWEFKQPSVYKMKINILTSIAFLRGYDY